MADIDKLNQAACEALDLTERNQSIIDMSRRVAESPGIHSMKFIQENSTLSRLLVDFDRQEALMRVTQGPLEELRCAGVFESASELHHTMRAAQEMTEAFDARFTLPEIPAMVNLMQELQQSPAVEAIARYGAQAEEIQRAMEAMHTPWLDAQEALRSVTGFAELQGIGGLLAKMPSFDDAVSAALRTDLGDWRDKIAWPEPVLTDLSAREAFYMDLGFDPSLTDFPVPAFRESTEIAGLRREAPPLVEAYGEPVPRAEDEEEEEALVRTNVAHDWLLRLESNLRRFIDAQMTAAFGPDWPKHQLPNGIYKEWMDRREAEVKAGRNPKPLVAYADFTDYERVMCKRDNWSQVFGKYFSRPENVRESFQRLHLIRLDTMHARPIGQDDQLLLYVEVMRLINVIDT